MADFPTTIYEERVTENLPGIVFDPTQTKNLYSEDFQNHAAEIIAIETALGEDLGNVLFVHREILTANRNYYVRTNGNDSNTGLANTSGAAFLTIQKAIDIVASLDLGIYSATISVADGTYSGAVALKQVVGYSAPGCLNISGNISTPGNVILNHTGSDTVTSFTKNVWIVKGFKITNSSGSAFFIEGGILQIGNIEFGACAVAHILVSNTAVIVAIAGYTISGAALYHLLSSSGLFSNLGNNITLSGTLAFDTFAYCVIGGIMDIRYITFSGGTITGKRYNAFLNGVINTNGGGANFFPGNSAGSLATGGQYA